MTSLAGATFVAIADGTEDAVDASEAAILVLAIILTGGSGGVSTLTLKADATLVATFKCLTDTTKTFLLGPAGIKVATAKVNLSNTAGASATIIYRK